MWLGRGEHLSWKDPHPLSSSLSTGHRVTVIQTSTHLAVGDITTPGQPPKASTSTTSLPMGLGGKPMQVHGPYIFSLMVASEYYLHREGS